MTKLLLLVSVFISLNLPLAFGMILRTADQAQEAAELGAGIGGAICALKIQLRQNEFTLHKNTSCVLIDVNRETHTGTVMTVAHFFYNQEGVSEPLSLEISFNSDASLDSGWIPAKSYRISPTYKPRNGDIPPSGMDLALAEFSLPAGFSQVPMKLGAKEGSSIENLDYSGDPVFFGSYGKFALSGAPEWSQERTKRIGHMLVRYKLQDEYPQIFGFSYLEDQSEMSKVIQNQPYRIKPMEELLVRGEFLDAAVANGDCGGPLFHYDGKENGFRVLGVLKQILGVTGSSHLYPRFEPITPEVQKWISSREEGWLELPSKSDCSASSATEPSASSLKESAAASQTASQVCSYCKSSKDSSMQRCGRCLTTPYCSQDCQVKHWPEHKKDCKLWHSSALLVLQGEVGFSESSEGRHEQFIKTSKPTSCTVLTLFHERGTALAHIDDYTSVESLFRHLESQFKSRFGVILGKEKIEARVTGGSKDSFSIKKQKEIFKHLKKYKNINVVEDSEKDRGMPRAQIVVSSKNGKVTFLPENQTNQMLELVQLCEYGDFNRNILDKQYGNVAGDKIPDFEIKEATRHESDLPTAPKTTFSVRGVRASGIFPPELQELIDLEKNDLLKVETDYSRKAKKN